MLKFKILTLVLALTTVTATAQSGGGEVFTFLSQPYFAGSIAQGGYTYLHPGPVGAYAVLNPLLLTDSSSNQIEISAGAFGEGIHFYGASYGIMSQGRPMVFSLNSIQYGVFEATDTWGNPQGTFTAGDVALTFGTQLFSYKDWQLGAIVKGINGSYESYNSWAVASDLILAYQHKELPNLAIVAKNIGTQLTLFSTEREQLPFDLLLVVSNKLKYMPLRWSFVFDKLNQPYLGYNDPNLLTTDPITGEQIQNTQGLLNLVMRHVGGSAEFTFTERLHLMMGYSFRRQYEMALPLRRTSGGFSFGAGVYYNKFTLHYARELRNVAGYSNSISLTLNSF